MLNWEKLGAQYHFNGKIIVKYVILLHDNFYVSALRYHVKMAANKHDSLRFKHKYSHNMILADISFLAAGG